MNNSKKSAGQIKIYAVSIENFEAIADKTKPVYVAHTEKSVSEYPIRQLAIRATGLTADAQWCELYLEAGEALMYASAERTKAIKEANEMKDGLSAELERRGFKVMTGVVSDTPVTGFFQPTKR